MSPSGAGVRSPLRIGVLAYPGCFASEVFGVPDMLTIGSHVAGRTPTRGPGYEVEVLSPRRRVVASGGAVIAVAPLHPVDVLVVPGFELAPTLDVDDTLRSLRPEIAAISSHAGQGAAVVGICVGTFLLAEAGLLDGRRATTSWLYADRLALQRPAVTICPDRLVVTDGGVTTTAGYSAMFDFALTLLREHNGQDVAQKTARIALVDDARTSQTPYVDIDLLPTLKGDELSHRARAHLDESFAGPYDLGSLAATLHVSTRTLLRRFRASAGQTPLQYLQSVRVHHARQLLETTDRTVATIAAEVGYRDVGSFSRLFHRHVGKLPQDYRATFRRRVARPVTGTSEA